MAENARATWQDLFALGFSTTFSATPNAINGAYTGHSGFLLVEEHPHLSSGQTTIENVKTTGLPVRVAGRGFEYQQGHKVPSTTWKFDATAHNVVQLLKAFFQNGYSKVEGTAYTGGYHAVFQKYTDPNPSYFVTLFRKFSAASANSHRLSGGVGTTFQLTGTENEAVKASFTISGRDLTYTYTWSAGTDDDSFDTSLDPLLWKNTKVAIGNVVEGYPGFTCAVAGGGTTLTFAGAGAMDMTTCVEPGSFIVFQDEPNVRYGPVSSVTNATTGVLETGQTATHSASSNFKVINFFHLPALDITMTNGAVAKAYNEDHVARYILNMLEGSGTINIPFSEIPAAVGGTTPNYNGSSWLNLFLEGGIVRFWVWWGDAYDCVLDSVGDGDFGLSFNIRATGEGIVDDNGEMGVAVPFITCASEFSLGTITSKTTSTSGQTNGFYGVSGTDDFIALGSEILTSNPETGIHRDDVLFYGTTSSPIRYVAGTQYLYLWNTIGASGVGGNYHIHVQGINIKAGVGFYRMDVNT